MYEFFKQVIRPVPPQDPSEGMLKLFLYSHLLTLPKTATFADTPREDLINTAVIIIIHCSAALIGYVWGAYNYNQNQQQEPPRPH